MLQSLSTIGNENALTQNERVASGTIAIAPSSSSNGNYDNDITNASCVAKIPRRVVHEQEHKQRQEQQRPESNWIALDAKIESMIENAISNANCNAGNTKRSNATVNDERHQRNDGRIACALHSGCCNDDDDEDDDHELAAGNTANPTENSALIRASQRNFLENKNQPKIRIDNNTDDTHKLCAQAQSTDLAAAAAAFNSNNNDVNRCDAAAPMGMPLTMIPCTFSTFAHTFT